MLTRSGLSTAPLVSESLVEGLFRCPIDDCDCFLAATDCGGTVQYTCTVGGHGRIAQEKAGRVLVVAPVLLSADGSAQVVPNRPRCCRPLCDNIRRTSCRQQVCDAHCILGLVICGCKIHDDARACPSPSQPDERVGEHQNVGRIARDAWDIIGWVHGIPVRARPAPMQAKIVLLFVDQEFSTSATVPAGRWVFDLPSIMGQDKHELEWDFILPGSLEFRDADGGWVKYAGGAVPMLPTISGDFGEIGEVFLRAKTVIDLSQFPLPLYVDTVKALDQLVQLMSRQDNISLGAAYEALFCHEATTDDLESIRVCGHICETSPPEVRREFEALGHHSDGSWARFVKACDAASPAEAPAKCSVFLSPLAFRQRRARGRQTNTER